MKYATLAIVLTAGAIATTSSCTASQAAKPPVRDVPAVTQPHLSLATYTGKPCRVFGVDQLSSFGVTDPGTPDAEQSTARCRWKADSATTIGITLFGATQGLSTVYATKGRFPYFQPTEVEKYPAVDRDAAEATTGTCATVVGIADTTAFEVNVDIDEKATGYRTPCEVSKQVAAVALANIQGGG